MLGSEWTSGRASRMRNSERKVPQTSGHQQGIFGSPREKTHDVLSQRRPSTSAQSAIAHSIDSGFQNAQASASSLVLPADPGTNPFAYPPPEPQPKIFNPHIWDWPPETEGTPPFVPAFPLLPSPTNPENPFSDPSLRPLEVDPSEHNPYNDPDYIERPYHSPFLITQNQSAGAGDPQGGLSGRLLALLAEQARGSGESSIALPGDAGPSEESEDKPVRILARRIVR